MDLHRQKRARRGICRIPVLLLTLIFCLNSIAAADGPVASVVVEPQEIGSDFVVNFAHPFKKGDVKDTLLVKLGKTDTQSQVNVKRRYRDGSVKHAVISTPVSRAQPGRPLRLDIYPATKRPQAGSVSAKLPRDFAAKVVFRFPDDSRRVADAGEFFNKASSKAGPYRITKWLEGPLMTEVQIAGPPIGPKGDIDPDLLVVFGLRFFKGGKAVRVEVVVESPWVDVPGNIPYDLMVSVGGKEVFAKTDVGHWEHRMPYWLKDKDRSMGHFAHGRWRKVFWWGKRPAETHIRYDLPYLVSTLLLPPYDTDLVISKQQLERGLKRWQDSPRGILENGVIMAYFPTTGGREDLGPYPTWTTRYFFNQDRASWQMVLGTGELAGSFPVHIRDRKSGRIFSIDEHPGYSLNPRGTLEKIAPRTASDRPYMKAKASPYSVDNAHQPSLAFVPYLLTGDYYYLEEMYFWANWCMLTQNASYRRKGAGLITPDQIRGQAWALRQLVDAAKISPDDHPEKQYFDSKVKNNLDYYNRFIEGPDATEVGTYTLSATDAYVRGRSPKERYKWLTMAPWQQNFLAWSLDHTVRAGYSAAAKPRDYFTRLQVGILTNPDDFDPRYSVPYFFVIGQRENDKKTYYTTWKELFEKTFKVVSPDTKPSLSDSNYGGSYAFIARAVLLNAVRNKVPGADEALKVLEASLVSRARVLSEEPTWAFSL